MECDLLTGELEVGLECGVTGAELLRVAEVEDGETDLVRMEEGVAEVEMEGGGTDTLMEESQVGFDGLGIEFLFVEAIGLSKGGIGRWVGGCGQGETQGKEGQEPGEAVGRPCEERSEGRSHAVG
jgi:hypothetical protein